MLVWWQLRGGAGLAVETLAHRGVAGSVGGNTFKATRRPSDNCSAS